MATRRRKYKRSRKRSNTKRRRKRSGKTNRRKKSQKSKTKRRKKSQKSKIKRRKKSGKKGKKRSRKHRMYKKFNLEELKKTFISPHKAGVGKFKNKEGISQLGDCALCTLKLLNMIPEKTLDLAFQQMLEHVEETGKDRGMSDDDIIGYLEYALSRDENYEFYILYSKPLVLVDKNDEPIKNVDGHVTSIPNNIEITVRDMKTYLTPGFMTALMVSWPNGGGHIVAIGLSQSNQLILFEPQASWYSNEQLDLIIGDEEVKKYLLDRHALAIRMIVGNYIDFSDKPNTNIREVIDKENIINRRPNRLEYRQLVPASLEYREHIAKRFELYYGTRIQKLINNVDNYLKINGVTIYDLNLTDTIIHNIRLLVYLGKTDEEIMENFEKYIRSRFQI
jgi:hypothetical protein